MLEVNVDQSIIEDLCKEEIQKRLKDIEFDYVMWDKNELVKRTCMSWSTIQRTFLYHPDCPKVKLGGKWYFPAKEMTDFLLKWVEEQKGD